MLRMTSQSSLFRSLSTDRPPPFNESPQETRPKVGAPDAWALQRGVRRTVRLQVTATEDRGARAPRLWRRCLLFDGLEGGRWKRNTCFCWHVF